jgi:hypothetical protein
MATLGATTFSGGAIGAAVTTSTEPLFTSKSGTVVYGSGPGGTQGMRPSSSTFGQMFINNLPAANSHYRIGWKVTFGSSTATVTIYQMVSLTNTAGTVVGEVDLRNSTVTPGTREVAFRDNFVAIGQTTSDPITAGSTWSFEWEVNAGASTVNVWKTATPTAAPDYQWTDAALSQSVDRMFLGPSANTGVDAVISDFKMTDGTPIYSVTAGAFAGTGTLTATGAVATLNIALNGYASSSDFAVLAKTTAVTSARLKYSTHSDLSSASFTSAAAPDSAGYQKFNPTGLTADTTYYWAVEMDGNLGSLTGQTKTLKAAGSPQSFRFCWASCFDTFSSGVFALIAARNPEFMIQLGDYGYQYITGGTNGNTAPTDVPTLRTHREAALNPTGPRALFANVPFDQMYSDCDGGGANSDGTFPGFASGGVQAAWRQQFANRTLPLSDCGARSWVVGRLRFVLTDETTLASAKGNTDNSSKTKLGTTQKAWFKSEIDAAAIAGQYIIWLGDGPWIESTSLTGNTWRAYNTERTELGNYITAAGMSKRMIRMHGDTHTLFADDGTNNSWGGFANFSAAPMHTTGQAFSSPVVTNGSFPTGTVNSSRQYGICDVTDDGSTITLVMKGYSSTVSSPTETNPVSMTLVTVSGVLTLAGSGTQTDTGKPKAINTVALSGAGVLSTSTGNSFTSTVSFTGSGTLANTGKPALITTAALSGSGALSKSALVALHGLLDTSGTGTLVTVALAQYRDVSVRFGDVHGYSFEPEIIDGL